MRPCFRLLTSPFALFVCFLFTQNIASAQQHPLAEMRGVWIATVANIDWPSQPGLSPERQRAEFDSLLDVSKAMGMNAVFVQVRPAGDAFYKSPNIPWSRFLSGRQGVAPGDSTYDPLQYMIEAAHKRHLEFHAWFNPYRATFDLDTSNLAPNHPLRSLPPARKAQWFFRYGNKYYFQPGNPLVIKHLVNAIRDVVLRYDVDGIHFDDYFYPYKEKGESIDDYNMFASDPRGLTNVDDWRRSNINTLVEEVSKSIKGLKPYVKFGISPFGVWRNLDKDPDGSDTRASITAYDDQYADVRLWLKNGWIDYVAPQLYWSIGYSPADYAKLVDWWSRHTYGKQLYIGHAAYKINNNAVDPNWYQSDQISRQVALNRTNPNVQGSIFYSMKPLLRNPLGVQDSLKRSLFNTPALMPAIASLSKIPPATPQICRVQGTPSTVKLAWHVCDILSGDEMPHYFGIFRFRGEALGNFNDPRNLLIITPFYSDNWIYEDQTAIVGEYYTYVVVAYNRANIPSYASAPTYVKKTSSGAKKKRRVWGYLFE